MELQTERDSRKKFETIDTPLQHEDICDRLFDCAASPGSSSPLITPTQVISDPVALENFIQLLSQKKKLEEDHAEASVSSKEMQWELQWKRWKLEAAKFAGKPANPVFRHSLQKMKAQYENLLSKHKSLLEKAKVAKHMLDFNDKEIELVGGNCLNKLTMEEPFLTVTLREFLYYKSLEREVSAHKYLENYYQKMSLTVFEELLNTGTILGNFIKFNNYIYKCLHDRDGITEYIEAKQNEIFSPLYGGDISLKVSSTELDQPEFPSTFLLQEMWDLMRNPVVEYEPSNEPLTDTETWENQTLEREHELSSGGVQSTALRSISTDTVIEGNCTAKQTSSLESSATATSSSNDILTIHHPKKYVSVESLLERGTTARTVPFSAVASEDNSESDDAKTRATTATDFEEAIQYSNSNLLQYMHTEMKRSGKSSSRSKKSNKASRPTTTVVSKAQLSFYGPTTKQIPQPWIQNGGDMNVQDENFFSSGSSINVGDHDMKSGLFSNAEVQVSEVDLVSCNSVRPLTFCYPNNYSNTRILPFDPGQGDR
ncbi:unnamed protein product [Allacma fusca]|uniref:Uncharacterized protein n=1 Tax=Allacma fusca TaxID=39272 RepID=A0A8J2LDC2_9HEXA|nr:unnamed protein product [Allacma fusca]